MPLGFLRTVAPIAAFARTAPWHGAMGGPSGVAPRHVTYRGLEPISVLRVLHARITIILKFYIK